MPSGLLINYYMEQPFTPPPSQPYDPAYPDVHRTDFRTSFIMFQKYKNLIPIIVKGK